MAIEEVLYINVGSDQELFRLANRAAATSLRKMSTEANSLISSVFVKSCDPGVTIQMNYFDTSSGTEDDGERYDLASHTLLGPANVGKTERILVTRIHNKPVGELIISGPGTAEVGVYVTGTQESASDIDSALFKDGADINLLLAKGLPIMCYDEDTGKVFLLRCKNGKLSFVAADDGTYAGIEAVGITVTPGVEQTLGTYVVPDGETYRLSDAHISCTHQGRWTLTESAGGSIIGAGRTNAAQIDSRMQWNIRREIVASGSDVTLTLKFKASAQAAATCVDGFVNGRLL